MQLSIRPPRSNFRGNGRTDNFLELRIVRNRSYHLATKEIDEEVAIRGAVAENPELKVSPVLVFYTRV